MDMIRKRRWIPGSFVVAVFSVVTLHGAARAQEDPPPITGSGEEAVQILPPLVKTAEPDTPQKDYENLQVLNHLRGAEIERVMGFFAETMGHKCRYCHNIRDYSLDEKEPKKEARKMIRLVQHLNTKWFHPLRITCHTCHDATTEVLLLPGGFSSLPDLVQHDKPRALPPEFVNVQRLEHLNAEEYNTVMDFFVASLGERNCRFCHNIRDYASDDKETKREAREMIAMVQDIVPRGWSEKAVTCYTCHRGGEHPPRFQKGWKAADVPGVEQKAHEHEKEDEEHGEHHEHE
jgi:hypothetical protein